MKLSIRAFIVGAICLTVIGLIGCGDKWNADYVITINGTITGEDTEPLPDVLVEITQPSEFQQTTTTDSAGAYQFQLESESSINLTIKATKNDYQEITRAVNAESGSDLTNINLSLVKADSTGGSDGDNGGEVGQTGPGAAAITLASQPPQSINISETGNLISAPITFQVVDSAGQSLSAQKAVKVQFELISSPGGDERLVPQSVTTNDQGMASTTLYSGNKAGEVKVKASIEASDLGYAMSSSPVQIAIHGGFPNPDHFSLSQERRNMEGFNIDNARTSFSVILGDQFSNPVSPGTIVYFKTTGGNIQGSGKTDADGIVEVELISSDPRPENGVATVTSSTVGKDDTRITKSTDIVFSTSKAKISVSDTNFDLESGDTKNIDYSVTDLNGNPLAAGTSITVEASENITLTGDTDITLEDYLNTGPDATAFNFKIQNAAEVEEDQTQQAVSITVTTPSGETTVYEEITGTLRGNEAPPAPDAASIELINPPNEAINITATGENVSTPLTYQVLDKQGNMLKPQKAVDVQFKLTSSPGGNEHLDPKQVKTNDQGQARTSLISGNQAGVVQIQATIELSSGSLIKSEPVAVSIHGGFPDEEYFNLRSSTYNIHSDAEKGNLPTIEVTLGDKFSNPIKPGTSVYFETTGGIIQGSDKTNADGQASVDFVDLEPFPDNGIATVTASTVGENNQSLEKKIDIIFSASKAKISATPTNFELNSGGSQTINYTITDNNDNPMAPGTQISVEGDDGVSLMGDTDIILEKSGQTDFNFIINDNGTSDKENINISITVTSPSGTKTTYDTIGKRIIEGSNQVGAAAIVLAENPAGAININETGDDVSAPLTFQVRDSLGRPLTAENSVEVDFELVSSPGGGEDLVPKTATTDGQGNVTTTLFSGNRAGEVKVQAIVHRPEVGLTVRSSPILIAIHGGFPDKNHFSLAPAKDNFEGFNINNNRNTITVVLGDEFSNPVKPGTVVYFETTGGIIQGSGRTDDDGIVEVDLISGDPRPASGIATITASTVNNNNVRIQETLDIVMSGSKATITANPTTFDIENGGGASFDYIVEDLNGNPMAKGTQVSIQAGDGIEVTGDIDFTLGNNINPGPGSTEFNFSIRDTDTESDNESDLTILISVTTPSDNTTTYSGIQGTRSKSAGN